MATNKSSVLGAAVLGKMALANATSDDPYVSTSDRPLINYLPPYMQEYLEIKAIMAAEQPEIDSLWSSVEQTMADQFIMDSTEYGVMRWESMLKISPKATDTLDERKFRILTRLNQELPYTLIRLRETLTTLCGADGFVIELEANKYHITIKLGVGNHSKYTEVQNLLKQMIPANLTQYIDILYNTQQMASLCRHMDLAAYTHTQVRNEVLKNA